MKEYLYGLEFTLNGMWRIHAALSTNCFNLGVEFYDDAFRINLGPLCVIFGRHRID